MGWDFSCTQPQVLLNPGSISYVFLSFLHFCWLQHWPERISMTDWFYSVFNISDITVASAPIHALLCFLSRIPYSILSEQLVDFLEREIKYCYSDDQQSSEKLGKPRIKQETSCSQVVYSIEWDTRILQPSKIHYSVNKFFSLWLWNLSTKHS